MLLTVSIIHDLFLSDSVGRSEESESKVKGKRGRPKKNSRYISMPIMKQIRRDQLQRLRSNSIRDARKLYGSIIDFMEKFQNPIVGSSYMSQFPDTER